MQLAALEKKLRGCNGSRTPNKIQKCPADTRQGNTIVGCMNRKKARHLKQPFSLHLALKRLHGGLRSDLGTMPQPVCGSAGGRAEVSTEADQGSGKHDFRGKSAVN